MSVYAVNGKEPVAAWIPSLDTSGNGTTTLTDLVGSNNGTLTNMDAATDWVADTDAGGVRALEFDGSGDRIAFSATPRFSSGDTDATLSLWVKLAAGFPDFNAIFFQSASPYGPSDATVQIDYRNSTSRFRFVTFNASTATILNAATFGAASADVWYFLVCGYNASTNTMSISVDAGTPNTVGSAATLNSVANVQAIGQQLGSSRYLKGRIDDVRMFDSLLDAADIAYLYNSGSGRGRVASGVQARRRMSAQKLIQGVF